MTLDRVRREPPVFRPVTVSALEPVTSRMVRISLTGPAMAGFELDLPAASIRLLLPRAGRDVLEMPIWNGNEFLHDDGTRPVIRTLTPLRFDPDSLSLDVEVVLHGEGPLSTWAADAQIGDVGALSGPGRGYSVDPAASSFVLAGDESALPAITQLLGHLPDGARVQVLVETGDRTAQVDLPGSGTSTVVWVDSMPGEPPGSALVAAVMGLELDPGVRLWAAGEAAAVQRIRRHLFEDVGLSRSQAVVRGYWKVGRGGDPDT